MQQVALEAAQEGAMLALAGFSHVHAIAEQSQARIASSKYRSFVERGWIDADGRPTESAPPSLRGHAVEPGKPLGAAAQGEQAWKETQVLPLASKRTQDQQHRLTVTEEGRIIRCSDFCTDLRLKFGAMVTTRRSTRR